MTTRSEIVIFLDDYLVIDDFPDDSAWNGLQIEGRESISKIVFTTDTGIQTFEQAIAIHADMIVVHHGIFWKQSNPSIVSYTKKRVKLLLDNGISLYTAHLPLDKHPEVGNNAQLIELLGFTKDMPFAWYKGHYLSFIGKSDTPYSIDGIVRILKEKLSAQCTVLPFGKKEIKTIAICSGGADHVQLDEAIDRCVDLFIAGEAFECYHDVRDAGINVIFAGHHATEILGVKALSNVVQERFNVEAYFIDIPTKL